MFLRRILDELRRRFADPARPQGLRFDLAELDRDLLWYGLTGVGLVFACYALRLRFTWWPIHPALFLVFGTFPANRICFSFLLGWACKACFFKYVQG